MLMVTHIYSMLGNQVRRQTMDCKLLYHLPWAQPTWSHNASNTYKATQTRGLEKESTNMIMMTCNVKPRGCYILSIWFCNCKEWRQRSCERYLQQTEHPSWQHSIHSEGSISILCPMCKQKDPAVIPSVLSVRVSVCVRIGFSWLFL